MATPSIRFHENSIDLHLVDCSGIEAHLSTGCFIAIPKWREHVMDETEKVFSVLVADPNLVFRFFATFSRFEYSLKRSGLLKQSKKAEADWDEYANSLRGSLLRVKDPAFQKAVSLLFNQPPKTQVVLGPGLDWKETSRGVGEQDENYILRLVKTVRNNLFHGGKYPNPGGPVVDVGRDRNLLEASITILKQCLQLSPKLRAIFDEVA